jgi:predicted ribosomally synthesized peptide with nif11-like leader
VNFDELKDPELQEKLKAATTPEEILALAKEAGFELSAEQLEAVSGGSDWDLSGMRCQGFSRRRALL